MTFSELAIRWTEQGVIPDAIVRAGIGRLLRERLAEIRADDAGAAAALAEQFIARMREAPIALSPEKANEQHYEVPAAFFEHVLGRHRKYSACLWSDPGQQGGSSTSSDDLDRAETAALDITCRRAEIGDDQDILELGCGWGSLTLWMARHHPSSRITAVSNSRSQREFIEAQALRLGLTNVRIVTCDMNAFEPQGQFDRVVSVEMFEHLRNWPRAFANVRRWLRPDGRFFMHVFVHRSTPYAFEVRDADDWMSEHFFSGGMMPSDDLPARFQDDLRLLRRWRLDGTHYQRTANAWLRNMDSRRTQIWPILEATYGADRASLWWTRWRIFFMSCAELFGYDHGQQWWVAHYLLEPRT